MNGTDLSGLLAFGIPSVGVAVLLLVVAILSFVMTILLLVFALVRRANARAHSALEQEGVVLDTGRLWMTIRYANFRAPGIYRGLGIAKTRGSLVLTRQGRIILMPGFRGRYWLVPANVTVGLTEDGVLHLHSDSPSNATGSIDYRVATRDAAAWVKALTDAGAKRA